MKWRSLFLLLAMSFVAVAARLALSSTTVLDYLSTMTVLLWSVLCLHIWSLQPADNLSLSALCQAYFRHMMCRVLGGCWLHRFRSVCQDVESAQTQTLHHILKAGRTTKYGLDHKMAEINSVGDFRSRMPLSTYDDYKTYVDRCVEGEKNVLFKQDVDYFAATSGTTSGQSKLYPVNVKQIWSAVGFGMMGALSTGFSAIPKMKTLKFVCSVWTAGRIQKTARNVKKGSLSQSISRHSPNECSPRVSYQISNEKVGLYVHMLFALREREVSTFITMTSSVLLMAFSMVEQNWEKFVRDIRRGEIDRELDIPQDIRTSLNEQLTPSAERGDELEIIFRSGCSRMVPRIWPHMAVIMCMGQGSLSLQTKVVRDLYVGPRIPFCCFAHMSTEGAYGLCLIDQGLYWPDTGRVRDDYVIIPNINYYEFISTENIDKDQPETLLAHEVEVNKEYEIVITSYRGLYRFRTGDLIRITGYRGNTPTYQLLQRVGDILNVHVEKVPEVLIREVMENISRFWKSGTLTNFAASENVNVDKVTGDVTNDLFYVIFIETDCNQPLLEVEKLSVDEELCRVSETYRAYRSKGTIAPPRIIQVRAGSFEKLRKLASDKNPLLVSQQYKHPRIVRNGEKISLLLNNMI